MRSHFGLISADILLPIATDLAADQAGKVGAGQSLVDRIEAVAGAAGRKKLGSVFRCCGDGEKQQE